MTISMARWQGLKTQAQMITTRVPERSLFDSDALPISPTDAKINATQHEAREFQSGNLPPGAERPRNPGSIPLFTQVFDC
jgi:hypothetical protein